MTFPKHISLTIEHNPHRSGYQTIEEYDAQWGDEPYYVWVTGEQDKAITDDSMWVVHWYPTTPVCSCCFAASTLEAALGAANAMDAEVAQ